MVPYDIDLVTDSQVESPAAASGVVNTYDVLFTATFPPGSDGQPRPYSSDLQVPKTGGDVLANIKTAVEAKITEVEGIYALGGTPPA